MKRFALCLLILAGLSVPAFADLNVAENLPKESRFVLRIDVEGILKSQLGASVTGAHDIKLNELKHAIRQHIGFDLNSVRKAWVISWKKDTAAIVLKGEFDPTQVRATFAAHEANKEVKRENCFLAIEFQDEDSGKQQLGAIIDGSTLVFGEVEIVNQYLRALGSKGKKISKDNPQVKRFAQDKNHLAATMINGLEGWGDFDDDIAKAIRSIWLSGNAGANITAEAVLDATDAEKAKGFEQVLKGFIALKGDCYDVRKNFLLHELIKSITFARAGTKLTAKGSVKGSYLKSLLAIHLDK